VERFIDKHQAQITGTISCSDRILFKGHLLLGRPEAMEQFIARQGILIKDFGTFVTRGLPPRRPSVRRGDAR